MITTVMMLIFQSCSAQNVDTVHFENMPVAGNRHLKPYEYIIPVALITAGTITLLDKDGDEFIFNNGEVREGRYENFRSFSTNLDDYLQHAPSLTTFLLSVDGVKGKHDLSNQAALYLKSEL